MITAFLNTMVMGNWFGVTSTKKVICVLKHYGDGKRIRARSNSANAPMFLNTMVMGNARRN